MAEEKKEETKEEQTRKKIVIELFPDELNEHVEYPVQTDVEPWESNKDVSKEWIEYYSISRYLARFLARSVNEAPECKDNIVKRTITAKMLLEEFLMNLNVNGYLIQGILNEIQNNIYTELTGKNKILQMLAKIQQRANIERALKERGMVS